jgi:serine phosphatase RsbU (regulator of sigma subunit)
MHFRRKHADCSDIAEITLMNPGDILLLYTDGVHDGTDEEQRRDLEELIGARCSLPARDICGAVLAFAVRRDERLRDAGEADVIDDKTVIIVKRSEAE